MMLKKASLLIVSAAVACGCAYASDQAVATAFAPSLIHLSNGAEILVAAHSSGTISGGGASLLDGAVRVSHFNGYSVTAGGFEVQAETDASQAIVRLSGPTVEVAALGGSVSVSDGGARLVRVASGTHMSFQTQSNQSQSSQTQTGASTGRTTGHPGLDEGDKHALLWSIAIIAGSAIVIGSIAAAEGKNPF